MSTASAFLEANRRFYQFTASTPVHSEWHSPSPPFSHCVSSDLTSRDLLPNVILFVMLKVAERPCPFAAISLDSLQWRQLKQREWHNNDTLHPKNLLINDDPIISADYKTLKLDRNGSWLNGQYWGCALSTRSIHSVWARSSQFWLQNEWSVGLLYA